MAYVFAQYFFLSLYIFYWLLFIYFIGCYLYILLVGLGPQGGRYGGPPGIYGDRGAGHACASSGWLPC